MSSEENSLRVSLSRWRDEPEAAADRARTYRLSAS